MSNWVFRENPPAEGAPDFVNRQMFFRHLRYSYAVFRLIFRRILVCFEKNKCFRMFTTKIYVVVYECYLIYFINFRITLRIFVFMIETEYLFENFMCRITSHRAVAIHIYTVNWISALMYSNIE